MNKLNDKTVTKLKKDDQVVVISGADKGRRGKVLFIDKRKNRVVVEGVNKRSKYIKQQQEGGKSGMVTIEFPINISNIMPFCEKCKKASRISISVKDKEKTRTCKKCGKSLEK